MPFQFIHNCNVLLPIYYKNKHWIDDLIFLDNTTCIYHIPVLSSRRPRDLRFRSFASYSTYSCQERSVKNG